MVLHAGTPVEGINLYNNGFSGGLLAIVLYPIISEAIRHHRPGLQDRDYFDPADTTPSATPSENLVQTSSTPSVDEEGTKRTEYPFTITTYNYNQEPVEYTFAKAPERVYAYAQDNIEILLSLGLADRIVAASGMDGEIDPELAGEFAKIDYHEDTGVLSKEDLLALEPDFIAAWYSTFSDKRLGDVDFWHERSVGTYMALNSGCRGGSGTYQQTVADECQDILTL